MNLLLDTSVIIDFTRQSDNPDTFLSNLSKKFSSFYISDITLAELYSGKYIWDSPAKMKKLASILDHITRLPTSKEISIMAGKIRAHHQIALLDAIIAATALEHSLPLATLNTKDFSPIKGLKLIER